VNQCHLREFDLYFEKGSADDNLTHSEDSQMSYTNLTAPLIGSAPHRQFVIKNMR